MPDTHQESQLQVGEDKVELKTTIIITLRAKLRSVL